MEVKRKGKYIERGVVKECECPECKSLLSITIDDISGYNEEGWFTRCKVCNHYFSVEHLWKPNTEGHPYR